MQVFCTSPQSEEAAQISSLSQSEEKLPPWSFHFQHNERYLEWTDSAQEQLLKLHVAEKLDLVRNFCRRLATSQQSPLRNFCQILVLPDFERQRQSIMMPVHAGFKGGGHAAKRAGPAFARFGTKATPPQGRLAPEVAQQHRGEQ